MLLSALHRLRSSERVSSTLTSASSSPWTCQICWSPTWNPRSSPRCTDVHRFLHDIYLYIILHVRVLSFLSTSSMFLLLFCSLMMFQVDYLAVRCCEDARTLHMVCRFKLFDSIDGRPIIPLESSYAWAASGYSNWSLMWSPRWIESSSSDLKQTFLSCFFTEAQRDTKRI